jgi:hypothetical protein
MAAAAGRLLAAQASAGPLPKTERILTSVPAKPAPSRQGLGSGAPEAAVLAP